MLEIHTLSNPEKVPLGQIDLSSNIDDLPIFIGTPFYGFPSLDKVGEDKVKTNRLLLLDLNVVSFIRQRKNIENIRGLFLWAAAEKLTITPIVALSEQNRLHKNPDGAFNEYVKVLKEDYFYDLPKEEVDRLLSVFREYSPPIHENTKLFCDYLVIIKHFYHKNLTLEKKIASFCNLVHERNVPVLAFAMLIGCVYFYVKENPSQYSDRVVSKVQSDMSVSPNTEKENKKLWNAASDIMLFMAPAEIFYNYEMNDYNFSFLASSDITVGLALFEICYGKIVVNQNRCWGHPGIRPQGFSSKVLDPLLAKYLKQSPQHSYTKKDESDPRKANLAKLVSELEMC